MSWLLDADVLSQPAKQHRDARVVAWLYQEREHCYTSSIVIAQLAYWVRTKQGRQREVLQEWLTRLIEAMQGESAASTSLWRMSGPTCSISSMKGANGCPSRTATSPRRPCDMGSLLSPATTGTSDGPV